MLKGLELARGFWEEHGAPAVREAFPEEMGWLAVGLAGAGSDCAGWDDEISRDHDWGPGFILWVPPEMDSRRRFALSALYDHLPGEYRGWPVERHSRLGGGRFGVKTWEEFFRPFTGCAGAPETWRQWMALPSWALAQACSGEVFYDGPGEVTRIRQTIRDGMPEDVRRKKIAARAALMAQAGQYNVPRCLRRGEREAALLAAGEFVREGLYMAFLLNRRHMPYYKWAFRALRELPCLDELAEPLGKLLTQPRQETIEAVCGRIAQELRRQGLSDGPWEYLEPHAYQVMKGIRDPDIAALHVMEG